MRSLLSLVTLAAIIFGLHHFYAKSFNPKPMMDQFETPILNPNHPEIQDTARALNNVEDSARAKVEEGKRLSDAVFSTPEEMARKAKLLKDAGVTVPTKPEGASK